MRYKLIMAIFAASFLAGCNVTFFNSKDNLIRKQEGYLLLSKQYVEFIPAKIDTSATLAQNLRKQQLGIGFYLTSMPLNEIATLSIYRDTTFNQGGYKIVPVELEYRQIKETNRNLRQAKREIQQHSIMVEGEKLIYKIRHPNNNIYYINASPLVTVGLRNSLGEE